MTAENKLTVLAQAYVIFHCRSLKTRGSANAQGHRGYSSHNSHVNGLVIVLRKFFNKLGCTKANDQFTREAREKEQSPHNRLI